MWWLLYSNIPREYVWYLIITNPADLMSIPLIQVGGSDTHQDILEYHRQDNWENFFTPSLRKNVAVCTFTPGTSHRAKWVQQCVISDAIAYRSRELLVIA